MYEVRITKHHSGKTYNVDLIAWERNGSGMAVGKAFNVSRKQAENSLGFSEPELIDAAMEEFKKDANRVADLYDAIIEEK